MSFEWANGLKIYDSEKRNSRVGRPPPKDNINVYKYNIQRSFSPQLFGQSKSNFIGNIYNMKGEPICL